jgi:mannose-6-phosphate isomerase-like protein (cupin superfamily)
MGKLGLRTLAVMGGTTLVLIVVGGVLNAPQAQTPATPAGPVNPRAATNLFLVTAGPETRAQNGKVNFWTKEDLEKPRAAGLNHIEWTPQYRLTMQTRPAGGPVPTNGELHENDTQIYIVTSGSGNVLVEGTVSKDNDYRVAGSEHRGGPMTGGRTIKMKTGDVLSIPPYTWHQAWGDTNQGMTYLMVHVHTPNTIP